MIVIIHFFVLGADLVVQFYEATARPLCVLNTALGGILDTCISGFFVLKYKNDGQWAYPLVDLFPKQPSELPP